MEIEFIEEITSTNDVLLERGRAGAKEDMVLAAFRQTGGKGRLGRSFFSPARSGLYMSILLHPLLLLEDAFKITTLMAVAAAEAIEEYDTGVIDIKWVNDLYKDGRKISGILTECSPNIINGVPEYMVCGIGINLFVPDEGFPEEIKDKAGTVFGETADGMTSEALAILKKGLAYSIYEHFMKYYKDLPFVSFYAEYMERSFLIGRRVQILNGPSVMVLGVDEELGLIVEHEDRTREVLRAGEVSLIL